MEEVRPAMVISLDEVDPRPDFRDDSLHNIIPDDCCVSALDALERKEIISLLVERIAQLPEPQKSVLALFYYDPKKLIFAPFVDRGHLNKGSLSHLT